jgi:hypothetical protein
VQRLEKEFDDEARTKPVHAGRGRPRINKKTLGKRSSASRKRIGKKGEVKKSRKVIKRLKFK